MTKKKTAVKTNYFQEIAFYPRKSLFLQKIITITK